MIKQIKINIGGSTHITNTYIIYDDKKNGILIDPSDNYELIMKEIKSLDLNIGYIIITHAHGDHIGALEMTQKLTNATIFIGEKDYDALIDKAENYCDMLFVPKQHLKSESIKKLNDNEEIILGNINLRIIATPGHTMGGICIYYKDENVLFTGDTIFADCYGRCDLYGGNINDMANSLKKVFNSFSDVIIYPGHGEIVNIESSKRYIRLLMALKKITI